VVVRGRSSLTGATILHFLEMLGPPGIALAAVIYVVTGGNIFPDKFRHNMWLRGLVAAFAAISTVLLYEPFLKAYDQFRDRGAAEAPRRAEPGPAARRAERTPAPPAPARETAPIATWSDPSGGATRLYLDRSGVIIGLRGQMAGTNPDRPVRVQAQFFVDWVDDEVSRLAGGAALEPLIVEVSLDLAAQTRSEMLLAKAMADGRGTCLRRGAIVGLSVEGRVRVYVDAAAYEGGAGDRVRVPHQAGTLIGPPVYLAAITSGRDPDDTIVDRGSRGDGWERPGLGEISLRRGFELGRGQIIGETAAALGSERVVAAARSLAAETAAGRTQSGGLAALSPLDAAGAFVPLANGGDAIAPYAIERIRTFSGKVIYQHGARTRRVLTPEGRAEVDRMLKETVASGAGSRARTAGGVARGYPGSTTVGDDAWFVGYAGKDVVAVWLGGDGCGPQELTGDQQAADAWRELRAWTEEREAAWAR